MEIFRFFPAPREKMNRFFYGGVVVVVVVIVGVDVDVGVVVDDGHVRAVTDHL